MYDNHIAEEEHYNTTVLGTKREMTGYVHFLKLSHLYIQYVGIAL